MQRDSNLYIYRQLYTQLKEDILAFKYNSHEKLPSKRVMSKHKDISINSVKAAYEQLLAEGYIYTQERKGYYIEPIDKLIIENDKQPSLETYHEHTATEFEYSFSHMSTDISEFPVDTWTKMMKQVFQNYDHYLSSIPEVKGPMELRQSIAKLISYQRGIHCYPEQIVIGSGTNALLTKLIELMTKNITIAVEDPGYSRFRTLLEQTRIHMEPIALDRKGISLEGIKDIQPNAVIVTPSHQFPIGTIMPVSRRIDLLNWASKTHSYIIEDDYDSEFRYSGKPVPALQGLDTGENVIYMGTFSKLLLPSLRISYMVLPISLINIYQEDFFFYAQTVSRIDQNILKEFLNRGHWEKHIQKMKVVYRKKRDVLITAISKHFPESVEVIGEDSGLHLTLRLNNGMTEQEAIDQAAKFGVKVNSVSEYGENDGQTVLLGFAVLSIEQIKAAVKLLEKAWFEKNASNHY